MEPTDITLEKWYEAKEKIAILEKRLERYRTTIQKEMKRQNVSKLSNGKYTVTSRNISRKYLSKDNVPSDIWNRYAVQSNSQAYYITKN